MNNNITVDPEFQQLIVPLSQSEFELLRSQILAQGCLEPLYVWKTENGRILLDGHNRLRICTENNCSYTVRNVEISDREQAKLWILEHQAGRRNLTDDQRAIIWNEIREQRSTIAKGLRSAKANGAKTLSVKTADKAALKEPGKPTPKVDTRAAVAKEAKLPESKLKQ